MRTTIALRVDIMLAFHREILCMLQQAKRYEDSGVGIDNVSVYEWTQNPGGEKRLRIQFTCKTISHANVLNRLLTEEWKNIKPGVMIIMVETNVSLDFGQ